MSAVKVPRRMALQAITKDMEKQQYVEAVRRLEILKTAWSRFEQQEGFSGAGIGNALADFAKSGDEETPATAASKPKQ